MRALYHFLGSVRCALILIAAVALFVILGTFLESSSGSHLYAAQFVYSNPIFAALLWGFFINILFSATRRWPFKIKHIPFLITHMGLLMILAGGLSKYYFGVQGSMHILEGSGTHEIVENNAFAIYTESKGGASQHQYPLKRDLFGNLKAEVASTEKDFEHLWIGDYSPHSKPQLASWIKGNHLTINGLSPIPINSLDISFIDQKDPQLQGNKVRFPGLSDLYHLYAFRGGNLETIISELYRQSAYLLVTDRHDGKLILKISLKEALAVQDELNESDDPLKVKFFFEERSQVPALSIQIKLETAGPIQTVLIPLEGNHALINENRSTPFLGNLPYSIDIEQSPWLAFIENEYGDIHSVISNSHGKMSRRLFSSELLAPLFAYNKGYDGYTTRLELLDVEGADRKKIEGFIPYLLKKQLLQASMENNTQDELTPPLQVLMEASKLANMNFVEACTDFLVHWNNTTSGRLYSEYQELTPSLKKLFQHIPWDKIPRSDRQACLWSERILTPLSSSLCNGEDIIEIMREKQWPLLSSLRSPSLSSKCTHEETEVILFKISQQIYAAAQAQTVLDENENELDAFTELSPERQASLLSAYFRIFGIHLSSLAPPKDIYDGEEMEKNYLDYLSHLEGVIKEPIVLETYVTPAAKPLPPKRKLEENIPHIALHIKAGRYVQKINLFYERDKLGLKWPIFNGTHLVRFQQYYKTIPYHVRLRNARQINYPNSSQPYSYESDLIIKDLRTGEIVEKTISMNNVHETSDGYRFYLASMNPSDESAVKRIQIAVNHDPTKYWLTYAGACILCCGIILLFLMRPYRNKS